LFRRHVFASDGVRFRNGNEPDSKKKGDADQQIEPKWMNDADAMPLEKLVREAAGPPQKQAE